MKLYDFSDDNAFNQLKKKMGAAETGNFVEFDPEHQLTFGEREALSSMGVKTGAGAIRVLEDKTLALKNSRVWIEDGVYMHVAACPALSRLRDSREVSVTTREPEKHYQICAECLAELKYLGLDSRRSRRMHDQLDELFSMGQFRQDYPFYPV